MTNWRRTSNLSYLQRWENKVTAESIIIAAASLPKLGWLVYGWKLPNKSFRTKTQALSFAKKYMRAN